jgi:hypothetical protein
MKDLNVKTAELIGPELDWAVAAALNQQVFEDRLIKVCQRERGTPFWIERENAPHGYVYHRYSPSTDRDHGVEIIEREGISVIRCDDDYAVDAKGFCTTVRLPVWCATTGQHGPQESTEHQHHDAMYQIYLSDVTYGPTLLIAAMRCYVASIFGAQVELPPAFLWDQA